MTVSINNRLHISKWMLNTLSMQTILAPSDINAHKNIILLISQLPPRYQRVIRMRYIKDLSLKEIAAITSQSENTVAVQIHRGIVKLKMLYFDT